MSMASGSYGRPGVRPAELRKRLAVQLKIDNMTSISVAIATGFE